MPRRKIFHYTLSSEANANREQVQVTRYEGAGLADPQSARAQQRHLGSLKRAKMRSQAINNAPGQLEACSQANNLDTIAGSLKRAPGQPEMRSWAA